MSNINNPFKFDFRSVEDIKQKNDELGIFIGFSDNYKVFSNKVQVEKDFTLKNSLAVHPMEGFDGEADGSPGELTLRRYKRFARSGAGLIWMEAVAVQDDARTSPRQLMITKENVDNYKALVEEMKKIAGPDVKIINQLTHSGRFSKPNPKISCHNTIMNTKLNIDPSYPCITDDYLKSLEDTYEEAVGLSVKAGFDGVDIKCCHKYLFNELCGAYLRENSIYGGSYENRTRMFKNSVSRAIKRYGNETLVTSRFGISDIIPYPYGFGMKQNASDAEMYEADLTETLKLIGEINKLGVNMLNLTMGSPYYNPHVNRPYNEGGYYPVNHPLVNLRNIVDKVSEVQKSFPEMTIIGTGYSYLREYAIGAAAYSLENSNAKVIGFGRGAFAYEGFAGDMINGFMDSKKACIACSKCTDIMRAGGTTGCPIRDSEVYIPIYKKYCVKK